MVSNHSSRSLVLIAQMLGRTHGLNVVFGGTDIGATDGKTIWLRDCSAYGSDEAADLIEGIVHHEAVHCRYTNFSLSDKNPLISSLANVFEDIWGETQQAMVMPGCQRSIGKATHIMVKMKIIDAPPSDVTPADLLIRWLVNTCRSQLLDQKAFAEIASICDGLSQQVFGKELHQRILDRALTANKLKSTEEAFALAREIHKMLEEADLPPPPQQSPDQQQGEEGGDQKDGGGGNGQKNDQAAPEGGDEGGPPDEQDGDSDQSQGKKGKGRGKKQPSKESGGSGKGGEQPQKQAGPTEAQKAAAKQAANAQSVSSGDLGDALGKALGVQQQTDDKQRGGRSAAASQTCRVSIGKPCSHMLQRQESARTLSATIGNRLEALIEASRNDERWNASSGKRLNMNIVPERLVSGNYRLFRRKREQVAVNTAVHLLTDVSGSMGAAFGPGVTRLDAALETAAAIGSALNRQDVPFMFSLFATNLEHVKKFDEDWRRCRGEELAGSGTNTHHAVRLCAPYLASREEERKILVIVTDGIPGYIDGAIAEIRELKRYGVEVACVFIGDDNAAAFGRRLQTEAKVSFALAKSRDELASTVFSAIKSAM